MNGFYKEKLFYRRNIAIYTIKGNFNGMTK